MEANNQKSIVYDQHNLNNYFHKLNHGILIRFTYIVCKKLLFISYFITLGTFFLTSHENIKNYIKNYD